jgi:hypothetical protein
VVRWIRRPRSTPFFRSRAVLHTALELAATALAIALAGCSGTSGAPGAGVAILPEHYSHSIAALGWPGARRAFQVGHGSVVANGEAALEWTLVSAGDSCVVSPVWFERDGVPVAHWTMTAADHVVEFVAVAAPRPALGDTSLVLSVRALARWRGPSGGEVVLEARLRSRPDGPHCVPWDTPDDSVFVEAWQGRSALRNGSVVAVADPGATHPAGAPTVGRPARTEGTGPGSLIARCTARLAPGDTRHWDFAMPLYPVAPGRGGALANASHEAVASESRRFWRDRLASAASLSTPDTLVNLAWRASLVTLVVSQERDRGRWVPLGNPFQYRDVWLRDGARTVRALAVAGLTEQARDDARTLMRFQFPSGVLLSQRGQLDGTGQALWAFEQAASLPPSAAVAREFLPAAAQALRWIELQRDLTTRLRLPTAGLLPYGNPRDGELVRACLVGNDAWALAGCQAVAALAARAGDDTLRRAAERLLADYGASFHRAFSALREGDIPPSWQGAGRDWGNVVVAYPTRVRAADDPRLLGLAKRMHARAAPTNLVCYGPTDSLHSYLGADLAQSALLAGRIAEAHAYIADLLAHSSSTLGQAEIFHRDGGFGSNLPPHATAAATIVDLLRNMLVGEEQDTLELARGAPLGWWRGTRLERAPTRFGNISLRLDRPEPTRLLVRLDPAPAAVRVRMPAGTRAVEALSPGAHLEGDAWVIAPRGVREVAVRISERTERQ